MSEAPSFQELLLQVRQGDQEAARTLVLRYEPMIRRVIRFRLADSHLARQLDSMDICQSVLAGFFVRVAAGQFDLEQPEQLLQLLVTMARNKLAMHARAQKRQKRDHRRVESGAVDERLLAGKDPTPSQFVAGQELLREAERLLSEEERELVELRKQGLEWGVIALRVGSTPDAVRKKLARGVDRVAHQLELDDFRDE